MSSIDKFLNKKYKCVKSDEFYDEYLKEIGLNFITRKLAKSVPPTIELQKISETEYVLFISIPIITHTQKFIPGEERIQRTMDGRLVKNIFEIEDNILIEYQIEENRKIKIVREYFEDEMKASHEFRDVVNVNWCSLQS